MYGYVWILWVCMVMYGNEWECMGVDMYWYVYVTVCMAMHGYVRTSMGMNLYILISACIQGYIGVNLVLKDTTPLEAQELGK